MRDFTESRRLEDAERLHTLELTTLFNVANLFAQPGALKDKAKRVLDQLMPVADAEWITLRVPDIDGSGLTMLAESVPEAFGYTPIPVLPVSGSVLRSGEPAVVHEDAANFPGVPPGSLTIGIQSITWLPVKAKDQTLGVMAAGSRFPYHFEPPCITHLSAVAAGLGILLDNARFQHQAVEGRQLAEALNRVSEKLNSTLDYELVLRFICQECRDFMGVSGVNLWVAEGEEAVRKVGWFEGSSDPATEETRQPLIGDAPFVTGRVIKSMRAEILNDARHQPPERANQEIVQRMGSRALMVVPLLKGDRCLGTISLVDTENQERFSERDLDWRQRKAVKLAPRPMSTLVPASYKCSSNWLSGLSFG